MNKHLLLVLLLGLQIFLCQGKSYASPGRTDINGGHTCYTNCEKYGLKYGEYHLHNGSDNEWTYEEEPILQEYDEQSGEAADKYYEEQVPIEEHSTENYEVPDQEYETPSVEEPTPNDEEMSEGEYLSDTYGGGNSFGEMIFFVVVGGTIYLYFRLKKYFKK